MRDVVKTNVRREQNSKRTRRRKKNMSLYVFLIFILVAGIGVLLSVTLLFNIKKINIKGDVDYLDDTVKQASGLKIGDNLVRLDAKNAEQKILSSLVYIEDADINKKYPDTLEINLKKCVPAANLEYDGGFLLVSKKGKILEIAKEADANIFTVKGFEPKDTEQGGYVQSTDEKKTKIYNEIVDAIIKYNIDNVVSIDMTDKYAIVINYDNRVNFELGNSNDIAYKIKLADTVLKDMDGDKKGTMVMVGANQISFRTDETGMGSKSQNNNKKIPINSEDLPEGYTEPESNEDENIDAENIDENTGGEVYDEQYNEDSYESYDENYDEIGYDENDYNYDDEYENVGEE